MQHYEAEQDQLSALTSLAGIFLEAGEVDSADTAYQTVARRSAPGTYRLFALGGYAHVAALRGDRPEYERRVGVLEAAGFSDGPAAFRAGAWIQRAEACQIFGELEEARHWYVQAIELAEAYKLGQLLIQGEEGLVALERRLVGESETTKPPTGPPILEISGIREGLDRMRDMSPALAGGDR